MEYLVSLSSQVVYGLSRADQLILFELVSQTGENLGLQYAIEARVKKIGVFVKMAYLLSGPNTIKELIHAGWRNHEFEDRCTNLIIG